MSSIVQPDNLLWTYYGLSKDRNEYKKRQTEELKRRSLITPTNNWGTYTFKTILKECNITLGTDDQIIPKDRDLNPIFYVKWCYPHPPNVTKIQLEKSLSAHPWETHDGESVLKYIIRDDCIDALELLCSIKTDAMAEALSKKMDNGKTPIEYAFLEQKYIALDILLTRLGREKLNWTPEMVEACLYIKNKPRHLLQEMCCEFNLHTFPKQLFFSILDALDTVKENDPSIHGRRYLLRYKVTMGMKLKVKKVKMTEMTETRIGTFQKSFIFERCIDCLEVDLELFLECFVINENILKTTDPIWDQWRSNFEYFIKINYSNFLFRKLCRDQFEQKSFILLKNLREIGRVVY